jgi:hypothetical protein
MGKKGDTKKIHTKQLRKEVQEKLAVALADYKNALPQEKYSKTLKKASKLFVSSFEKTNGKEKEKPAKMKSKKESKNIEEQVHEN